MKKCALDELAMTPRRPTKKELFEAAQEYLAKKMHDRIPLQFTDQNSGGSEE